MKGKISKINPWKTGKGSFVKIDGTEYIILSQTDAKVGDEVNYEIGDKEMYGKKILAHLLPCALEAYIDSPKEFRAHDVPKTDARETYWQRKEIREIERDGVITMLSCMSSAACVYEGTQSHETEILKLAELFFERAISKIKKASP